MAPPPYERPGVAPPDSHSNLLGHVASAVMHSVINRISAVVSQAEILKTRRFPPEELSRRADAIIKAALEGATLARRLSDYGQAAAAPAMSLVDLDALIAARLDDRRGRAPPGVELVEDLRARAVFLGDPERLAIMLDCLIDNAFEALAGDGRGGVVTVSTTLDPLGWLELDVRDDGPGMAPDVMQQVLEPFFTTKPDHHGLGLLLARSLWRRHRGAFSIDAPPGGGVLVRLTRPSADS